MTIPTLAEKKTQLRRNCIWCSTRVTSNMCALCGVALCEGECFNDFHRVTVNLNFENSEEDVEEETEDDQDEVKKKRRFSIGTTFKVSE